MFTRPEEFIFENFKSMPMWVRVVSYFAILLVVIYGYMAPKYINGMAYIKLEENGLQQYLKSTPYNIMRDGRAIKLTTNEEGLMSIPLSTIFHTKPIKIDVFPNGYAGSSKQVEIPLSNIMSGEFTLTYIEEKDSMYVTSIESIDVKTGGFNFIKSSYAASKPKEVTPKSIRAYVFQSVAEISKIDISEIEKDTLIADLLISRSKTSYLYAQLEDTFKVVVWSEIWNEAITINDLVKILYIATNPNAVNNSALQKINELSKFQLWQKTELPN